MIGKQSAEGNFIPLSQFVRKYVCMHVRAAHCRYVNKVGSVYPSLLHVYIVRGSCACVHCVISQRRSHECCSCCCCSWLCQVWMHYSLPPIGGSVNYTLHADLKVEQQKEQQCNSWLFAGVCAYVCVFSGWVCSAWRS